MGLDLHVEPFILRSTGRRDKAPEGPTQPLQTDPLPGEELIGPCAQQMNRISAKVDFC